MSLEGRCDTECGLALADSAYISAGDLIDYIKWGRPVTCHSSQNLFSPVVSGDPDATIHAGYLLLGLDA